MKHVRPLRLFRNTLFTGLLAGSVLLEAWQGEAYAEKGTKDTLNFVNYRDVRDLNPHLYAGEMYAQEMLYETLIDITQDGFKPCLAESWTISEDGKVYTGRGADNDIIVSSAKAYVNAINRMIQTTRSKEGK